MDLRPNEEKIVLPSDNEFEEKEDQELPDVNQSIDEVIWLEIDISQIFQCCSKKKFV